MGVIISEMKMKQCPTQEYLNSILEYRDGELYWKKSSQGIIQGKRAGNQNQTGYRNITIDGLQYGEHRIIWTMFNGIIRDNLYIDHINRVRNDNRIENLRVVNRSLNALNNKYSCISFDDRNKYKKYIATIKQNSKKIVKSFYTEQEATEWVAQKKSEIFEDQGFTLPIYMVE